MKKVLFRGCATALATPFTNSGIDEQALRKLVNYQIDNGVAALIACGTTGEPSTMTQEEWAETIQIIVDETKKQVPVIAGTGGNNTAEVIHLAALAEKLGAQAQLCVTPYYNKTTQQGLIAHYTAIADSSNLPVIIYNVPSRTGLSIAPETVGALSHHDNIIAVKEASADMIKLGEMIRLSEGRLAFYSGTDEVVVPLMSLGGLGVISVISNAAPALTVQMTEAMLRGDMQKAAELQLKLLPLTHALFSEVNPIPLKAAMHMMGICENQVRLPLVPLGESNARVLEKELKALGLLA